MRRIALISALVLGVACDEGDVITGFVPPPQPASRLGMLTQPSDVTVLEAIYHVVEHFSMHTGQIILLAKAEQADRIRFYDTVDGHPRLTADFHGRTPVHPR